MKTNLKTRPKMRNLHTQLDLAYQRTPFIQFLMKFDDNYDNTSRLRRPYNNIQDSNQKLQNFLKITNSGAATQQQVV